jgi:uncharacterized iron-regulated protein
VKTQILIPVLALIAMQALAETSVASVSRLYNGQGQVVTLDAALDSAEPGSVIVLGEQHNNGAHQQQHLQVLRGLRDRGLKVSVGMEFVSYIFQEACAKWQQGILSEEQFLSEIQWGGNPFHFYRDQMAFPRFDQGEKLIALNAPRSLTRKIAREGLDALTETERALLPPQFALGNDLYFERFMQAVGGHLPGPDAARRYFAAQSTWDDTMAWKAKEFFASNPDQVLVVIVGEFHVQYGGGLPDRLRARGLDKQMTFSQLNLFEVSDEEAQKLILPDPKYGQRADFVWTSDFSQ